MSATCTSAPRFEKHNLKAEWSKLSPECRARASGDVYGNDRRTLVKETSPDFITNKLQSLQEEIDRIPTDKKEAYELAQTFCPDYVNSTKFLLSFLRADLFDTKAASQRVVRYWDEKVALFGPDRAFKKVSKHDLDHDDMNALKMGGMQLMPEKDKLGRGIIVTIRSKVETRTQYIKNQLRSVWYLIHSVVDDDEEVQKNGLVHIASNIRSDGPYINSVSPKLDRISVKHVMYCLPVRFVAIHCIIKRPILAKMMLPYYLFLIGSDLRARYREYDGNNQYKYLDALNECGISRHMLPTEIGGTSDYNFTLWLENLLSNTSSSGED